MVTYALGRVRLLAGKHDGGLGYMGWDGMVVGLGCMVVVLPRGEGRGEKRNRLLVGARCGVR
jgi:hypothetical protein